MKRLLVLTSLISIAAFVAAGSGSAAANSVTRCVGGPKCYATIQAAVDASADGDTIVIARGTFAGGVTITKSVALRGAGAGATTIKGGGPALTIGTLFASTEPTVSIDGVTITGALTTSSVESTPFVGQDNVIAAGGGIEVPPADNFELGATVTVTNSVITGNTVAPTQTVPFGPPCPTGPCPFASALGGGIDTWGSLTLSNSVVSSNSVSGVASDADGGGIASHLGDLVIQNSRITGNRAVASVPNGRFAEGGAVYVENGSLTISNTVVDGNSASLTTDLPVFADGGVIDMNANSGGIHVGHATQTTIQNAAITNNSVTTVDPNGEALAFDAAMLINDGPLTMTNTVITGNRLAETVATTDDVGPGGTAIEVDGGGSITNTLIDGNYASSTTNTGNASASGGLAVYNFSDHDPLLLTVSRTVISHNTAVATSKTGSASVFGAGIFNNSLLALQNVTVTGNVGKASGPSGTVQGGGIWNGVFLSGPPVELSLDHTTVTGNQLVGSSGMTLEGGGVFTTESITQSHTTIAGNSPDQCSGC